MFVAKKFRGNVSTPFIELGLNRQLELHGESNLTA